MLQWNMDLLNKPKASDIFFKTYSVSIQRQDQMALWVYEDIFIKRQLYKLLTHEI